MKLEQPVRRHRRIDHKPSLGDRVRALIRTVLLAGAAVCLLWIALAILRLIPVVPSTPISEIKSGFGGYCLDDYHDSNSQSATVDTWQCNGSLAQNWTEAGTTIKHGTNACLTAGSNSKIVLKTCNGASSQVWARGIGGYENPESALCLAVPSSGTGSQVEAKSCNQLTEPSEVWAPATWNKHDTSAAAVSCNTGQQGTAVACYAAREWAAWQSGATSHTTLLSTYTDGINGNSSESWCADFVSYVYKEAGYPFTYGERDGWDEYLADNIQYMGLVYHDASGYTPKPGDIAYFSYPGGHVEIVAVGGPKPIFIYGDSGSTDQSTGNGNMTENTLTSYQSEGQLVYYLSPN